MNELSTTQKITALVLLLAGVAMLIIGWTTNAPDEFHVYWMATTAALLCGGLMLTGLTGVRLATRISRVMVGSVFIVSGLIKANDTLGFSYKLEEYFDESALGSFWAMFFDFALPIAMIVTVVEVILGLAVLFGAKARLTNIVLLLMTLFFGWLTWYTATCNDAQTAAMSAGESFNKVCVNDCGCFGDALRGSVGRSLTPWESFYKDLTLLFFVIVLVVESARIKLNSIRQDIGIFIAALAIIAAFGGWLFGWWFPMGFTIIAALIYLILKQFVLYKHIEWIIAAAMVVLTFAFVFYTYMHLPIKDYRPYAVGKNITDQMKSAEELGLEPTIYANIYVLKHKETGETITEFSNVYLEQKMWNEWEVESASDESVVVQRGYEPPIPVFSVSNEDGEDIGMEILEREGFSFIVIAYDIHKTNEGIQPQVNEFAKMAEEDGIPFFGITSSAYNDVEAFRHENQNIFPYYNADEIFLKTIIRSNPGLLLMENGTVLGKWHFNDFPEYREIKANYLID